MKLSTFLICLLTVPLYSQTAPSTLKNPLGQFAFYHNTDQSLTHLNFFEKMGAQMQISTADMVLETRKTDEQGFTHYKYQQYYQELPIFGCHYFLHEKDGFIRSANGQFQPNANLSTQATLSAQGAEGIALQAMRSRKFDRENTQTSLCFFNPSPQQSSKNLHLAYKVDLQSTEPINKRRYFIDANTGKILQEFPLILEQGVPSKAKTYYYGIQDIISDSLGPANFVLRDLTRGKGIKVLNTASGLPITNNSSFWDLGSGTLEASSLDAMYCSEKYYDMMLGDYHWNGIDGQGGALIAKVQGGPYVNAYWDGAGASFGDGDCVYGPLTTLEVVGHEFTHGMVDYTSNLVYGLESGAMNESLADMFGKLLERKTDPTHFSWEIAHSFILNTNGYPFRIMNDPNAVKMPAYYKGKYWDTYNDVHYNSSIGNLWFSMIVDGKQGINEVGYAYNVSAIGPDKAGQIIFNTNKNYLSENSTYNNFCNYSIEVAGNLYGQGSTEQLAVIEAWKAVGLPFGNQGGFYDLIPEATYFYNSICETGNIIPITFSIYNNGETLYNPANMGAVTLSSPGLPDHTVTITNPIAPQEWLDITVEDWFKALDYGAIPITIKLNVMDDDTSNNLVVGTLNVVPYASNDLALFANVFKPDCFQTTQTPYFYVVNNSCEAIPANTQLKIIAKNSQGNTVWSGPQEALDLELQNGYSASFTYAIPVFTDSIVFYLVYPDDPNAANNQYDAGFELSIKKITDNYLNTFEVNNGEDTYLQLSYLASTPTLLYQNNHFFAATGFSDNPAYFSHCDAPSEVFTNLYYENWLRACVNYSSAPAPTLEFDAAFFLNTYANASNYNYSSMLLAKWEGSGASGSGSQIIANQTEGQLEHTKIDLPHFFKGQVTLVLYTEMGQRNVDTAYLNKDDFVLLDNFKLSANTSASHEEQIQSGVLIAPNPARETVSIQSETPMNAVHLFNAAGQLLQTLHTNSLQQNIDLQKLPGGLYWIKVSLENETQSVQKLIKLN